MPDLLVRSIPEPVVRVLKRRAARHRRSLQQELASILGAAARETDTQRAARIAAVIRARLARTRRRFSDSTPLIRQDRAR